MVLATPAFVQKTIQHPPGLRALHKLRGVSSTPKTLACGGEIELMDPALIALPSESHKYLLVFFIPWSSELGCGTA